MFNTIHKSNNGTNSILQNVELNCIKLKEKDNKCNNETNHNHCNSNFPINYDNTNTECNDVAKNNKLNVYDNLAKEIEKLNHDSDLNHIIDKIK